MADIVIEGKCDISDKNVQILPFVRIKSCKIGDNCLIESFSFLYGVNIGNNVRILGNVFIPQGVVIRDNCVICPGVTFVNTKYPGRGGDPFDYSGEEIRTTDGDNYTEVGEGTVIGANSVIGAGVKIGKRSFIGMGSVVTRNVPELTLVYGNPAVIRKSQGKFWQNWNDENIIDSLEEDWNTNLQERRTLHRVLKELREKNPNLMSFLDAGCGTLVSYPFIKEYGYTYSGVDVTEEMIERAKGKFPEADIWVQDVLELSDQKQYDVILNAEVIYHVPDVTQFINALWKVTGKVLVIKAAYMWTKPSRPDFDGRFYNWKINVDELVSLLQNLKPTPKNVEVVEVEDDEKTTAEFDNRQVFVVYKGEL